MQIPITSSSSQADTNQFAVPSVIDQTGITIPAGWDSRGKILALKEGFEVDSLCDGWDADVHVASLESSIESGSVVKNESSTNATGESEVYEDVVESKSQEINKKERGTSAIKMYEEEISALHPDSDEEDPSHSKSDEKQKAANEKTDFQLFLASQYELLEERIKEEEEGGRGGSASPFKRTNRQFTGSIGGASIQGVPQALDINIGGIQIEGVEEVLRRLKIQEMASYNQPGTPSSRQSNTTPGASPYDSGNMNGNDAFGASNSIQYVDGQNSMSSIRRGSPQTSKITISDLQGSSPASKPFSLSAGVQNLGGGLNSTPTRLSSHAANRPDSPTKPATPTAASKSQNEVLANFFQTLLDKRNNSPGGSASGSH